MDLFMDKFRKVPGWIWSLILVRLYQVNDQVNIAN